MSMILTAYNAIKPLPPEGSEEWLAMLPGWTGWKYQWDGNRYYISLDAYGNMHWVYWDYHCIFTWMPGGTYDGDCSWSLATFIQVGPRKVVIPCEDSAYSGKYIFVGDYVFTSGTENYYKIALADAIALE